MRTHRATHSGATAGVSEPEIETKTKEGEKEDRNQRAIEETETGERARAMLRVLLCQI